MNERHVLTGKEMRDWFIQECRQAVDHWEHVPDHTDRERLAGLLHNVFAIIDGVTDAFPCALTLTTDCGETEPEEELDDDVVASGVDLNSGVMLHDLLHEGGWK